MTDAELLPLFAKMLPNTVGISAPSNGIFWLSNDMPFQFINPRTYLSLCHQIEEGMTDEEFESFDSILWSKCVHTKNATEGLRSYLSAPWQARIQTAAKVKGLL